MMTRSTLAALIGTCLLIVPAGAGELRRANDLSAQRDLVFAALREGPGWRVETARGAARVDAIRRAFLPFRGQHEVGGERVALDATGLSDLARAWGDAVGHGEGEVAIQVACWASERPGAQAAFLSALEAERPYRINGWSFAREGTTPAGCTRSARLDPAGPSLPRGLTFGMTPGAVERAVGLTPTRRRSGDLAWSYDLPAAGREAGWTETLQLRALFRDGRLAALSFTSLVTN